MGSVEDRLFFVEAFPLLISFLSSEPVKLGVKTIPFDEHEFVSWADFAALLRARHALACTLQLVGIVERLEEATSTINQLAREESKGGVSGQLDVSKYIARRYSTLAWPRTYPVVKTRETPDTPENGLARSMMTVLARHLSMTAMPQSTAEGSTARSLSKWLHKRLRRTPWCDVRSGGSVQRMAMEARRRVWKRQTANDHNYATLLRCYSWWEAEPADLGQAGVEGLASAILAFPSDEGFLDRVFEIWCLKEVLDVFRSIGATPLTGLRPLYECRGGPMRVFQVGEHLVEVWYQRPFDSSLARWRYDGTGQPLRGIPDILLVCDEANYFVIDAKKRFFAGTTRPEETYKMLGYLENYRAQVAAKQFFGALCFISDATKCQRLSSVRGDVLALLSADEKGADARRVRDVLAALVIEWIGGCCE